MNIELRWVVPAHTTTAQPVLQYRTLEKNYTGESYWSKWQPIPTVVMEGKCAI